MFTAWKWFGVYVYRSFPWCKIYTSSWNVPWNVNFLSKTTEWFDVCWNWERLDSTDCPSEPECQALHSSTINKTRPVSIIHQKHPSSAAPGSESGEILVKSLSCDEFCRWRPAKGQYQWYGGVGACVWLFAAICLSKQHQLFVSPTLSKAWSHGSRWSVTIPHQRDLIWVYSQRKTFSWRFKEACVTSGSLSSCLDQIVKHKIEFITSWCINFSKASQSEKSVTIAIR